MLAFTSDSETTTHALAQKLASRCNTGDCVLLSGDLGTGKTTFARGFIQALCENPGEIVSPTFTLAQTYDTRAGGTVWHFDLYRLKSPADVWELGLEDALLTGISLIEWPQMAEGQLPQSVIEVQIDYGQAASERVFHVKGVAGL
jgi:tRNA threonylcarbamoyladenosine biosynthesis protein TsaE